MHNIVERKRQRAGEEGRGGRGIGIGIIKSRFRGKPVEGGRLKLQKIEIFILVRNTIK